MRQRRYLKLLFISILSLGVLLSYNWLPIASQAPVAFAHAYVIGSDPVDGSTVATPPAVMRIFFNETIGSASIAHVFAPDGHIVDAARSSISRADPRELDTPLMPPGSLPQGGYTVRWTAVSNDDGHTTHGVIGFNIGQSSVGLPGETILGPSTSNILPQLDLFGVLSVAWDWLVLLALTFWVGILVMEGLVLARFLDEQAGTAEIETSRQAPGRTSALLAQARKQSQPLQWLALAALLVGELIALILRTAVLTQALGGSGIDLVALRQLLLETNYGHLWLMRVALTGIAVGLLWWTTRQQNNTDTTRTARRSRFNRLREQVAQEHGARLPIAIDNSKEYPAEETSASPALAEARTHPTANRNVVAPFVGILSGRQVTMPKMGGSSPSGARLYIIIGLTLAGLILLTIALASDTAQLAQPHTSAVMLNWLYLAAQSMWFGALAYLGYVLLPLLPVAEADHHAEMLALLLRRLTSPTLGTLGVLLVSALFLSESSLGNAQQLLTDPYGRALLVKILLLALIVIFTLYALFIIRPRLAHQALLLPVVDSELPARRTRQSALERTEQRLGQTLKISSWLAGGVLLCAALMTFYAPPIVFPANSYAISTNPTSPATAVVNAQTQQVGNLTVTLQVLPGRIDYANTVLVTINDSRGNPVTDAQVQLSTNMELMNMGTARATIKGGNPTYIATFAKNAAFSMLGLWDIIVRIQRPNQAAVQAVFEVTLAG